MHVEDAIRHRRSIRRFLPDAIPPTALREMLALASMAPNIGNRQMWRFIILTEEPLRQMLGHMVERRITEMSAWPEFATQAQRLRAWKESALLFMQAPVVIIMVNQGYRTPIDAKLVEHGMRPGEVEALFARPDIQSLAAVTAYLTLLAEARGYGTCWLTDVLMTKKDLQASLGLAPGEDIAALLALGLPAEYPPPKARKAIDDIIEWR
ncbi:MAG TPA: nitroreductase family protein [Armatimonadota bacterium]